MSLSLSERQQFLATLTQQLQDGTVAIGAAVRQLRTGITGLRQDQFAAMCRISLSTLKQLEYEDSNPTVRTLKAVFEPFGLTVGIVPRRPRRQ